MRDLQNLKNLKVDLEYAVKTAEARLVKEPDPLEFKEIVKYIAHLKSEINIINKQVHDEIK